MLSNAVAPTTITIRNDTKHYNITVAGSAKLVRRGGVKSSVKELFVGDSVSVQGTCRGTIWQATRITNNSLNTTAPSWTGRVLSFKEYESLEVLVGGRRMRAVAPLASMIGRSGHPGGNDAIRTGEFITVIGQPNRSGVIQTRRVITTGRSIRGRVVGINASATRITFVTSNGVRKTYPLSYNHRVTDRRGIAIPIHALLGQAEVVGVTVGPTNSLKIVALYDSSKHLIQSGLVVGSVALPYTVRQFDYTSAAGELSDISSHTIQRRNESPRFAANRRAAFVANGSSGLQIIDLKNPLRPRPAGSYKNGFYANLVSIENNTAYLADDSGVTILDVSNLDIPKRIGFVEIRVFGGGQLECSEGVSYDKYGQPHMGRSISFPLTSENAKWKEYDGLKCSAFFYQPYAPHLMEVRNGKIVLAVRERTYVIDARNSTRPLITKLWTNSVDIPIGPTLSSTGRTLVPWSNKLLDLTDPADPMLRQGRGTIDGAIEIQMFNRWAAERAYSGLRIYHLENSTSLRKTAVYPGLYASVYANDDTAYVLRSGIRTDALLRFSIQPNGKLKQTGSLESKSLIQESKRPIDGNIHASQVTISGKYALILRGPYTSTIGPNRISVAGELFVVKLP